MSGRGVAVSWIVTHHRFSASHIAPVTLVFVRPIEQDDIVMPGFWLGASPPVTGMSVAVNFVDGSGSEGSATLLGWQPA
jgi:hypothetical protein